MLTLKVINYATHEVQEKVLGQSPDKTECLIGRTPGCDLLLDNPEVSRVHGKIFRRDNQYFFTDLGSTDGSRLNNEMLLPSQDIPLQPDDLIRICEFVIVVESILPVVSLPKPQSEVSDWSPSSDLSVRCVQVIDETSDVKTFRFAAEPKILFDYQPGQFVTLQLPIAGKTVLRSYSISSTPSRPHLLEITVKRVPAPANNPDLPPGLVSNWLHDNLVVGSRLKLKGPFGQFTCGKEPAQKLLLISAGSGITPMMAMTRWLCDTATDVDIVFAYSARSPEDIVFRQELEQLDQQHKNLKLAVTTTRCQPGQSWLGYRGRMDEAMVRAIAPDFCDRDVFVCGPNPFMGAIKSLLETMDFPMAQYHEESFGAPVKTKASAGEETAVLVPPSQPQEASEELEQQASGQQASGQQPVIVFTKSDQEVDCDGEDSILDVAESAGIELASACRMGACGACKQRLCSGKVAYFAEPSALEEAERAEFVLPCVARPVGRVMVEA